MEEHLNISKRLRRNRKSYSIRSLLAENNISKYDFIMPLFIRSKNIKPDISSLPGVSRYTISESLKKISTLIPLGLQAIILFPVIEDKLKTDDGRNAWDKKNILCEAIKQIKKEFSEITIIVDVALDPYTSHGHDGIFLNNDVENDLTVKYLCQQSLVLAQAGADIIAPSDMMDGRVAAIRQFLDKHNFTHTSIMSYAVKYASSLYLPFRDALSTKKSNNKKTYQMNPANSIEALREVSLDITEGADMIIIKPALHYLDIILQSKQNFSVPIFAFHVSGEFSMLHNYGKRMGCFDQMLIETLIAFKRAGATGIITYNTDYILENLEC